MSLSRYALVAVLGLVASVAASAVTYEGTTVSKSLNRSGKDLVGEARSSLSISADIYRVTTEWRWIDELVYDCEDDLVSDGTSGDWKGFFNAPKADKPARLAAAIKGVGISTAEKLIADGYFDSKPRSWSEFARRISDADDDYQTGFSTEVLSTYKKENLVNLGYLVEGQCAYKTVSVRRLVPVRKYYRTETRNFDIRVVGAPLLTNENESITISFDGFDDSIYVNSSYNSYDVDRWELNGAIVFELKGVRKQVRPANSLSVSGAVAGGTLKVQVSDSAFDKDVNSQRYIVGSVEIDRPGWKSNQKLGNFRVPLNGASSEVDLGISVAAGTKINVHYQLQHEGSRFHSNDSSSSKKSKFTL